jgi:anion-transporting  ArsA/GET3 family ATPase
VSAPRLHLVTGKGGVGKSTFAAALAVAAAKAGHRVLAIEMGSAPGSLSTFLGAYPVEHGVPVPVAPNLSVSTFDGEAALAEYLLKHLPMKRVLKAFFKHPLYRAFVSAGPGVRELMAIGKVRDEVLGLSSGTPQWDRVVVDLGASGHALQLLGMPAATARTFGTGLAHREASRVAGFLADPAVTAIHVVALPEVMPLEEAAEVIERLRGGLALPVGRLVINQCRPAPPPGAAEWVGALAANEGGDPARWTLAVAARRALGWLNIQERGIEGLERRLGLRAERLPRIEAEPFGRREIGRLAELVGEGVG